MWPRRITICAFHDFIEFEDADQYALNHAVADAADQKTFVIGDYTPIPYWQNGITRILTGGISLDDFDREFGHEYDSNSVTYDLRRIVRRARTGEFRDRIDADQTKAFLEEHRDIFDLFPVNSRYWVSRYRLAVLRWAKLPESAAKSDAKEKLRNRVVTWVQRFRFKGSLRYLVSLLSPRSLWCWIATNRDCSCLPVYWIDLSVDISAALDKVRFGM